MELDTILTIVGVVLIAVGLYIFVSAKGKGEGSSNKLQGFGVTIDVANPSVLLIIIGAGLVLVPRFFPDPAVSVAEPALPQPEISQTELASKPAPEPLAAEEPVDLAKHQSVHVAPPAEQPPVTAEVAKAEIRAVAVQPVPAKIKAETPAETPLARSAPVPKPVENIEPPKPAPPVARVAEEKPATSLALKPRTEPAPKPAPLPVPKPVASVVESRPESVAVPAEPVVQNPGLWVMVDAEVAERAGITGMSREEYSQALRQRLAQLAEDRFGAAHVSREGGQGQIKGREFKAACSMTKAPRVLLATVRIPPMDFSSIESAFWPNLELAAVNCKDGRMHSSGAKRLSPQRQDEVFFERDFIANAERFIASQAYFLK